MQICRVEILAGRKHLLDAMKVCRFKDNDKSISLSKLKIAIAKEHGVLSKYIFNITAIVPDRVHTHLRTHHLMNEFYTCSTSRPDITEENGKERMINFYLPLNRLIEISRLRLCYKSWNETRIFWEELCLKLEELEPALKGLLAPRCVHYGFCKEDDFNCDYRKNRLNKARMDYLKLIFKALLKK